MKMKNLDIYNKTQALIQAFNDNTQRLPIKVNFYLQKNKTTLLEAAQEIEQARIDIASNFGKLNEETQEFEIPSEKIEEAEKELNDLFNIEQDIEIKLIPLENFSDDLTLTTGQMEALMFMIQE